GLAPLLLVVACNSDRRHGGTDLSISTSSGPDGGDAYGDLAASSMCCPSGMPMTCGAPVGDGCGPTELCGTGSGNGLDDNCDGKVDEGCLCTPGDVQKCFNGPPGKR